MLRIVSLTCLGLSITHNIILYDYTTRYSNEELKKQYLSDQNWCITTRHIIHKRKFVGVAVWSSNKKYIFNFATYRTKIKLYNHNIIIYTFIQLYRKLIIINKFVL